MKNLLYVLFAWLVAVQWAFAAININTAAEADLEKLSGIGPAKAKAIVEDRKKNGPFKSIADIKRVKGIGDATLEKFKNDISIVDTGAPAKPAASAAPAPAAKPAVDDKKAGKK